jgi:hypothetical protein
MRGRRPRSILCAVPARSLEIVVAVDVDGSEISGEARCAGESRPFLGWLGLIGVLDALLEVMPDDPSRAAPERAAPETRRTNTQPQGDQ